MTAKNIQYYCVGFFWYGSDPQNQLPRFKKEGIWENGFDDKYLEKVKRIPVGSQLAAKTSYTRKEDGKTISVLEVHAIGTVISNKQDGKVLEVKWKENFTPFKIDRRGAYRSTISQVNSKENIELIFGGERKKEDAALDFNDEDMQIEFPMNQILYGAPGTGKTFNTINKAVAIIDGIKEESIPKYYETREDLKERFDELRDLGQIIFCTFHQSMSYEDFIEGIKPTFIDEDLEEGLGYHIEDGIFKRLCITAKYDFYKTGYLSTSKNISRAEFFNIAYDEFISEFEEKLDKEEKVPLITKTGLNLYVTQITNQLNLKIKHEGAQREKPYTVSKKRLLKLFNHFKSIDEIKNIHKDIRGVIGGANTTAYWAVLSLIFNHYDTALEEGTLDPSPEKQEQNYETIKTIVNSFPITREKLSETAPEKYVLIIDEINRGNVSQIFGELITLIEDDKRLGKDESLEVCLPYSKDKFGIPPNVYLLGTMNTADRSVEALDAALRRRFNFEEVLPKPELIAKEGKLKLDKGCLDTIDLPALLIILNNRIEKLLDKDHQIGHSYFMSVLNYEDLKSSFRNKIIPLLQEYFFGDYGKIGLVIGKEFFEPIENNDGNLFADFGDYDASNLSERTIYKMKEIDKMSKESFYNAIDELIKK